MAKTFQTKTLIAKLKWKHTQATWFLIKNRWVLVGAERPFSRWFGNNPEDSERLLQRRKIPFKWVFGEQTFS